MATYAIGDIQGCLDPLKKLLKKISFNIDRDKLYFTGDLVNRGPQSLESLRFIKSLGDNAVTVLGNHDIHLLAVAEGLTEYYHPKDTINEILEAPDKQELLFWLRQQPLLYNCNKTGFTLIHAGLPPQWNLSNASSYARMVENELKSDQYLNYLENMYGNEPDLWSDTLPHWDKLRYITNCFTRLRYCNAQGKILMDVKDTPGKQPPSFMPWFLIPDRASKNIKIIFGHWSTLREQKTKDIFPIDTGCLWGGELTALRLDDDRNEKFCVPCKEYLKPF